MAIFCISKTVGKAGSFNRICFLDSLCGNKMLLNYALAHPTDQSRPVAFPPCLTAGLAFLKSGFILSL